MTNEREEEQKQEPRPGMWEYALRNQPKKRLELALEHMKREIYWRYNYMNAIEEELEKR